MKRVCTDCNEEKQIIDFSFCNKKGSYTNLYKKCKNDKCNTENKKVRKAAGTVKGYSHFQL